MFKFKIQPVLEHRRMMEDEAKRRFQLAQAELNRAREAEAAIAEAMAAEGERIRMQQRRGLDMRMRAIQENWFAGRRRAAAIAHADAEQKAGVVETFRHEFVEAQRGVKILEKLRERQRAQWQREEDRREQMVFDEIAVREFNQRRGWEKDAQQAAANMERNA